MSRQKWARTSTRQLSQELHQQHQLSVSPRSVARLLKKPCLGFSLKANRKTVTHTYHPDRNQQFEYIAELRQQFARQGEPILSVDAKKKELIGNFANPGRLWCRQAPAVSDHDFRSQALGIANPFGLYDPEANAGWVVVGTSHDTPEFASDALAIWLKTWAPQRYPALERLLILADTGGSNGCRPRAWKYQLQKRVCDVFQLAVTVCHYPTGASKYNPIEHRLFSFISINWAGQPLRSFDIALDLIRSTTTATGLQVDAILNPTVYATGVKITDEQIGQVNIRHHDVLPQWNYTIYPTGVKWN